MRGSDFDTILKRQAAIHALSEGDGSQSRLEWHYQSCDDCRKNAELGTVEYLKSLAFTRSEILARAPKVSIRSFLRSLLGKDKPQ